MQKTVMATLKVLHATLLNVKGSCRFNAHLTFNIGLEKHYKSTTFVGYFAVRK